MMLSAFSATNAEVLNTLKLANRKVNDKEEGAAIRIPSKCMQLIFEYLVATTRRLTNTKPETHSQIVWALMIS